VTTSGGPAGPGDPGDPEIVVVADAGAAAEAAARLIATSLTDAVDARGRADWATTGGSTPVGIYRRLSTEPLRDAIPWAAVHVWWGDDRYVPRDHPLSNVMPLDDVLLLGGRVRLPVGNLHPFPTGAAIGEARGPAWCAAELGAEIRAAGIRAVDGWPVLDLVLLGVGGDGHILSVFPGSATFDSTEPALAVPAPTHIEPHVARVTLNPAIVTVARTVLVVALGSGKADIVGAALGGERDVRRLPAGLARRRGATWILDEAAAARLPHAPAPR
jgi:6-phosphogluconolactonase